VLPTVICDRVTCSNERGQLGNLHGGIRLLLPMTLIVVTWNFSLVAGSEMMVCRALRTTAAAAVAYGYMI